MLPTLVRITVTSALYTYIYIYSSVTSPIIGRLRFRIARHLENSLDLTTIIKTLQIAILNLLHVNTKHSCLFYGGEKENSIGHMFRKTLRYWAIQADKLPWKETLLGGILNPENIIHIPTITESKLILFFFRHLHRKNRFPFLKFWCLHMQLIKYNILELIRIKIHIIQIFKTTKTMLGPSG